MKRTKVAVVVHKSAVARMWTDIGIFECDVAGVLRLLPEQKLTAVIRMLAYGSSADQVDEIARMVKSTMLEALQGDYRNRKCQKSIIFEAVAGFDTWVWHAFFRVAGSQNNLNVLGQSPVFNDVLKVEAPNITYQINNTVYQTGYYLADGIYPRWTTFVKSILNPPILEAKIICFLSRRIQERCRKVFWHPPTSVVDCTEMARMFDEEVLRSIMMTCIIFHNMIVEDEYDNDAVEVYEPDPMNTALTRIYKRLVGPSREPLEQEPLVRDGRFMTRD
ncbi:unnamed protein product [Prunus armeniaca]